MPTEQFWPNKHPKAELSSLWMSTEANFQETQPQISRLKISDEWDCLPADAYTIEQFGWTAFGDLVALTDLIKQHLEVEVCIDIGTDFYETKASDDKFYVGYYLTDQWHNPIISVLASSPEAAQARIDEELCKPGRHRYWQIWVRDGRLVKEKRGGNNSPISG